MMKYHRVLDIAPICPKCGGKGYVYDSRADFCNEGWMRRRRCEKCGHKWKTIEIMYADFVRDYEAGKYD